MTTPHYHDPMDDWIYEQELATEAAAAERERLDAEVAGTEEERLELDAAVQDHELELVHP